MVKSVNNLCDLDANSIRLSNVRSIEIKHGIILLLPIPEVNRDQYVASGIHRSVKLLTD